MTSEEIFNYVRKLELENAALKAALAEYKDEEEQRIHLIESIFGFFSTSPAEQSAEKITPGSIPEKKSEEKLNGIYIICN